MEKQTGTSFTTNGSNYTELPDKTWSFILESIALRLSDKLKNDSRTSNSQIWTIIPNDQREWIEIDQLIDSVFSKKRDLLGLDFNSNKPILANGEFWIKALKESKEDDLTMETRNIYIVDLKMDFFLFYIENNGLMVYGKDKSILLRK